MVDPFRDAPGPSGTDPHRLSAYGTGATAIHLRAGARLGPCVYMIFLYSKKP